MRRLVFTCMLIALMFVSCSGQEPEQLKSFELSEVKILEGPFYQAQQTGLEYILALDMDRLLAPFLKDAGIDPIKDNYTNWENTGLDGHIGGHYLSALSFMYAADGSQELLDRINYMVDWLDTCQQKNGNGYVGGVPNGQKIWKEIKNGKINAGGFSLNHSWVPLYNIHKIYAGLRDVYLVTGNEKALNMLIGLTDWMIDITSGLSDEQVQDMLISEHGGLNETFVDLAEITGDEKYIELARRFSHNAILDPLLESRNELTGLHANTQIPKVIGYKRYADVAHNSEWDHASDFFWNTVINDWTISIGGNSVREHFHSANDFSSMIESNQGPETCNTYNMLRLSKLLFLGNPDSKYTDYFERALFNHILSSEHPTKGGFVYFTPMRPRHYRVYSQPHQGFWCCVGSGLENPGKYGDLVYSKGENSIWVNLFIASEVSWKDKNVSITQKTNFPYEEGSEFSLKMGEAQKFEFKLRKPEWVEDGSYTIKVNGKGIKTKVGENGYVTVARKWKDGDQLKLSFKMKTQVEYLPDSSQWVSIVHGPIVLGSKTDTTDLDGLWADDSRMGHVAQGRLYPVDEAPMLVSNDGELGKSLLPVEGKPLHFKLSDAIFPEKYKDLELQPFFEIHEARYMVYWPIVSAEGLEERKKAIEEKEREFLALEAITVDQVATGEQQPESDHAFKGEHTYTGISGSDYWRGAKGWFSYELNNKKDEAKNLRITYRGIGKKDKFKIFINGVLLDEIDDKEISGEEYFDKDYQLSEEILNKSKNGKILIKFEANKGFYTPRIFYVRLLKEVIK